MMENLQCVSFHPPVERGCGAEKSKVREMEPRKTRKERQLEILKRWRPEHPGVGLLEQTDPDP